MTSLKEIAEILDKTDRVLLCGHIFPDGDCIGSVAALGLMLKKMGKKVIMASPDPVPENLWFLPGIADFSIKDTLDNKFDAMVVLDCAEAERIGWYSRYLDKVDNVICIDHHLNSKGFKGYNYIDPKASATGEIIFDLIQLMGHGLTKEMAQCLYTAIVTDTGSFRYEKTTAETLRKAAVLMDTGIDTAMINTKLFEEIPLPAIRILGEALNNLKISPCGKVAWMVVDRFLLNKYSAKTEHTDGLVNKVRSIMGVEVSIFFKEIEQDKFKISFRSKGQVNVDKLAAKFGGGGHARASGSTVAGRLQDIVESVVSHAIGEASKVEK